ncbi:serine/threonine protein kinase [bacterium]|nr:serine/threonine protein kinase [bacterium]
MIDAGLVLNQRFEVVKRLGVGGMGEVYLGRDVQNGQSVAIKRMLIEQDVMDKELFDRRFREEVSILRRLDCPGIPAFVEAFSEDGHSFLVMEYIEGYSLERLLCVSTVQHEGLSPEQVATVALHVSRVLEYLHSLDPPLVHRDIKPSNLIIRESDQRIFLVDFGLAREVHSKSSAKTQVGTWSYAPIEQIRGFVEPRSDFYSLGVTMLELLSGEVPKALAVPPARKLLPQIPELLAQIIDRCTKAEVSMRYPEAVLLSQDLEQAIAVISNPQAGSESPVSQEQAISELVRRWGQGRAPEPGLPPVARAIPLLPGASPEVKKAVDRARRRLFWTRPEIRMLRSLLFLIGLAVLIHLGWKAYQSRRQEDLARSLLSQGSLGSGWTLLGMKGLNPYGPNVIFSSSAAALFRRTEDEDVQELSFFFKSLKGEPDLLVFSGPYGIHVAPQGKSFQAELVQVTPGVDLKAPSSRPLGFKTSLASSCAISLVLRRNQLFLSKDGRELPRAASLPVPWRSQLCGAVQTARGAEALVSALVCRPVGLR